MKQHLLLIALAALLGTDSRGDTFVPTGSLADARLGHCAVMLPNGKVMVAAGSDGSVPISTAELFNPATGVWSITGSLANARLGCTAVLLSSGKVLVAGGQDDNYQALSSCELYNPSTGIWAATGNLNIARIGEALALKNGKVLVAGGLDSNFDVLSGAELYDPMSGKWSNTGSLNTPRAGVMVLLSNGKVLVAGGITDALVNGAYTASAEIYDPSSGKWTVTGNMTTPRNGHTLIVLQSGKVLAVGGVAFNFYGMPYGLSSAELYDPATGTWTSTGGLNAGRAGHTATLLSNGNVLVAGGGDGTTFLDSAELYDPAKGTWTTTSTMNDARNAQSATLLQNGNVLLAGGYGSDRSAIASAELYESSAPPPNSNSTLTVQLIGPGTVSPNYNGQTLINGKIYTMTAKPLKGCQFTGWSGSASSASSKLPFTMAPGLSFAASFSDVTRPVDAILSPKAKKLVTAAAISATGRAKDNISVGAIYYQFNNGLWTLANGTMNWSTPNLPLAAGANVLRAFAIDSSGNRSLTNSITFNH
jgi:N-acetylneuraminic acid mutarotase